MNSGSTQGWHFSIEYKIDSIQIHVWLTRKHKDTEAVKGIDLFEDKLESENTTEKCTQLENSKQLWDKSAHK